MVLIILFVAFLFKIAMPKFTKLQYLIDELNLVAREILTGVSVIRAFSREKHEEERFGRRQCKTDEDQPVCKPLHDLYDAGDDAFDELRYGINCMEWFSCSE